MFKESGMNYLFYTILLLATLIGFGHQAQACSCFNVPYEEEFQNAGAVFTGRAVFVSDSKENREGQGKRLVIFKVDKSLKGVERSEAYKVITTGAVSAACGFDFEAGKRYQVWTNPEGEPLVQSVNLCSRTESVP
jgi:hypothetical protein